MFLCEGGGLKTREQTNIGKDRRSRDHDVMTNRLAVTAGPPPPHSRTSHELFKQSGDWGRGEGLTCGVTLETAGPATFSKMAT